MGLEREIAAPLPKFGRKGRGVGPEGPNRTNVTGIDLLDYIILAAVIGFIWWRLFAVLGRRTGHENTNLDPLGSRSRTGTAPAKDNVVNMPGTAREADTAAPAGKAGQGILDIQLADRNFNPAQFLGGAKQAYEMIVTAFAEGNRRDLRSLLSDEVFDDFDRAIRAREDAGQRVESTFIGIEDAAIAGAELNSGRYAEVTVKFVSEMITVTKNSDGAVIEGDPTTARKVTDIWTFSRDTKSADPNWVLISTDEE